MTRIHSSSACAAALVALAVTGALAAAESIRREDQLKAAYLVNFVKFIEWPSAAADEPLVICFVGATGIRDALASGIENKHVGSRPLSARSVETSQLPTYCSVLYVDGAMTLGAFQLDAGAHVLSVSDAKGFARNGGIIELFTDSNRLRFAINLDNAQKAGLRISSSLLQLAATVEKGSGK